MKEASKTREETCCFTGHRKIPEEEREQLARRLEATVEELIRAGVRYFVAGGALGFDTLAAQTILKLRTQYSQVKLILVLPCETQTRGWPEEDVRIYEEIKKAADIQEIEVIINCMAEDENVQRIVSALDSLNTKLCCRRQGELFQIALNDILYIESVDRKTFIYTEQQIYETDKRLYELENHLKNRSFFRASKAVIINLKRTKSIRPEIGARLLLTMDNGEKVIVSRQYSSNIKTALGVM